MSLPCVWAITSSHLAKQRIEISFFGPIIGPSLIRDDFNRKIAFKIRCLQVWISVNQLEAMERQRCIRSKGWNVKTVERVGGGMRNTDWPRDS